MNESKDFDFTQCLTDDQIKSIAERVCEKQMTEHVDQILKNREFGQGTIVDQILFATSQRYTEKLSSQFEEAFMKRCQDEIMRDTPLTADEQTFRGGLVWSLQKAGEKYIEANAELIQSEMKDTIIAQARLLVGDKISYMISKHINVKDIINQILTDELQAQTK